jgi:O-antigen/teichoic acid export membrane protein
MNLVQKTAANTFWLLAAQIVTRAAGFLVTVLLARALGTEGFGVYAFVCAYVGFFAFLTDMGMDVYVTREASCDLKGSEALTGTAIVAKVFLSVTAFCLSMGAAWFLGVEKQKLVLIAIASSGLLLAPLTLYGVAFSATLQLHYTALFEIAGKILLVLLLVLVLSLTSSLAAVFVALVLPGLAVASLNVLYARRLFRPKLALDGQGSRRIVIQALPIALGIFCIQVLMRVDQVMLEWLRGDHELGLYSSGVKCCEALHILPAIVTASVFPLLARTAREGREKDFLTICSLSFKYLSLALFPCILLLFVYPEAILSFLFGKSFLPGASALSILCGSVPLVAMGYILMCATVSRNQLKAMLGLSVWLALSNVLLNLLFIPRAGPLGGGNGAALATVLSLAGLFCLALIQASMRRVVVEFLQRSVKPAAAIILPFAILHVHPFPPLAGALIASTLYVCAILLLKGLDKDELARLRARS